MTLEQKVSVPQGSVPALLVSNIFYDDVLAMDMPSDCELVAYADELVLIMRTTKNEEVKNKADERINRWMERSRLMLAPEKTEAVVFH